MKKIQKVTILVLMEVINKVRESDFEAAPQFVTILVLMEVINKAVREAAERGYANVGHNPCFNGGYK